MRKILHIGLGRTGTSFFQINIIPFLKEEKIIQNYDLKEINEFLFKLEIASDFDLEIESQDIWGDETSKLPSLVSYEGLVGPPSKWDSRFQFFKKIFDREIEILISFREPIDWLRSNFLFAVKSGAFVNENDYFVRSKENRWEILKKYPQHRFCNIDYVNYQKLVDLYRTYFKKVIPITMISLINPVSFCENLNLLEAKPKSFYSFFKIKSAAIENKNKINVGYSALAIKITKKTERVLNSLGLSLRYQNFSLYSPMALFETHKNNIQEKKRGLKELLKTIFKYIFTRLRWRKIWYGYIPSLIRLPKFKFPENLNLNSEAVKESILFFESLNNKDK